MARPRAVEVLHLVDFEILVRDQEGDRTAQRDAAPDARQHLDAVGFDLLSSAATVAALSPGKLGVNRINVQFDAGGKSIDQGQQSAAMRFTGGKIRNMLGNSSETFSVRTGRFAARTATAKQRCPSPYCTALAVLVRGAIRRLSM